MDEASPTNRLIFSQGRRPFKPVWDDGLDIILERAQKFSESKNITGKGATNRDCSRYAPAQDQDGL